VAMIKAPLAPPSRRFRQVLDMVCGGRSAVNSPLLTTRRVHVSGKFLAWAVVVRRSLYRAHREGSLAGGGLGALRWSGGEILLTHLVESFIRCYGGWRGYLGRVSELCGNWWRRESAIV
jgi:hypothetical protein